MAVLVELAVEAPHLLVCGNPDQLTCLSPLLLKLTPKDEKLDVAKSACPAPINFCEGTTNVREDLIAENAIFLELFFL